MAVESRFPGVLTEGRTRMLRVRFMDAENEREYCRIRVGPLIPRKGTDRAQATGKGDEDGIPRTHDGPGFQFRAEVYNEQRLCAPLKMQLLKGCSYGRSRSCGGTKGAPYEKC